MIRSHLTAVAAALLFSSLCLAEVKCGDKTYPSNKGECPEKIETSSTRHFETSVERTDKVLHLIGAVRTIETEPTTKNRLECYYTLLVIPRTLNGAKAKVDTLHCEEQN